MKLIKSYKCGHKQGFVEITDDNIDEWTEWSRGVVDREESLCFDCWCKEALR